MKVWDGKDCRLLYYCKIRSLANWTGLGQFGIDQVSEIDVRPNISSFQNSQKLSFPSTGDFEKS
ncbi:hypothetical protein L873DRAFT_1802782 [Choiromyces venosus 120613-1]|uniref:Uncharacterized protein n=1 Tax=Choiromyces venosus 120613-1 TaxID=1336337 RepID=A0A3N4JU96_9PEZI|nr:hypothetical protein L873DRAFT_1802782 [Choiromyces venosus 120613-1]